MMKRVLGIKEGLEPVFECKECPYMVGIVCASMLMLVEDVLDFFFAEDTAMHGSVTEQNVGDKRM